MMLKRNFQCSILFLILTLFEFILPFLECKAIPVFARKYRTSCTTCHVAFTKRNPFGESFRRSGYIMPMVDSKMVKEKPVKLGAEEWKELWPDAIWPGVLPETFPIATYSVMRVSYNPENEEKGKGFEFDMPLFFNLVFGGAFGEDVAFFGEWGAYAAGQNASGLQRFFFQFNSIVGPQNFLNVRVGRFEPGITDGYTSTQRLTLSYPIILDYNPANFTTGQAGWKPRDPQSGIELNGIIKHNLYYAAGIVNGESRTISDPTDRKDVYLRLAYQFGAYGFDGETSDTNQTIKNNSEDSFMLGLYSYYGSRNNIPLNNVFYDNNFQRYGFDFTWHFSQIDLMGGMIYGKDDNPDNDLKILKSLAYFVEGNYNFYPWLIGVLRIEHANSWKAGEDREKFFNIVPNITVLYRANIRFSLESSIKINEERNINGVSVASDNEYPIQGITLNAMIAF